MKLSSRVTVAQDYDSELSTAPVGGLMSVGPTVGTLEHAILTDMRLNEFEKRNALQQLNYDTGYAAPDTPLHQVVGLLGGGVLGMMVARLIGLGSVGMGIAGIAGVGIGKTISDFYLNQSPARNPYMLI